MATAPVVDVAILSGTIRETGPDYAYSGGHCGRAPNSVEMAEDGLWYVRLGNPVRTGADLIIWHQGRIEFMHGPGDCDSDGVLFGFVGEGNLTEQIDDQSDTRRIRRVPGGLAFGEQELLPGGTANWTFHASLDHTPMGDGAKGNYSYDGVLVLRYLGPWPASRIHVVADCRDLPSGC